MFVGLLSRRQWRGQGIWVVAVPGPSLYPEIGGMWSLLVGIYGLMKGRRRV